MPVLAVDGGHVKAACVACIRGHRVGTCQHFERVMIQTRTPGRPQLAACACSDAGIECHCSTPTAYIIPGHRARYIPNFLHNGEEVIHNAVRSNPKQANDALRRHAARKRHTSYTGKGKERASAASSSKRTTPPLPEGPTDKDPYPPKLLTTEGLAVSIHSRHTKDDKTPSKPCSCCTDAARALLQPPSLRGPWTFEDSETLADLTDSSETSEESAARKSQQPEGESSSGELMLTRPFKPNSPETSKCRKQSSLHQVQLQSDIVMEIPPEPLVHYPPPKVSPPPAVDLTHFGHNPHCAQGTLAGIYPLYWANEQNKVINDDTCSCATEAECICLGCAVHPANPATVQHVMEGLNFQATDAFYNNADVAMPDIATLNDQSQLVDEVTVAAPPGGCCCPSGAAGNIPAESLPSNVAAKAATTSPPGNVADNAATTSPSSALTLHPAISSLPLAAILARFPNLSVDPDLIEENFSPVYADLERDPDVHEARRKHAETVVEIREQTRHLYQDIRDAKAAASEDGMPSPEIEPRELEYNTVYGDASAWHAIMDLMRAQDRKRVVDSILKEKRGGTKKRAPAKKGKKGKKVKKEQDHPPSESEAEADDTQDLGQDEDDTIQPALPQLDGEEEGTLDSASSAQLQLPEQYLQMYQALAGQSSSSNMLQPRDQHQQATEQPSQLSSIIQDLPDPEGLYQQPSPATTFGSQGQNLQFQGLQNYMPMNNMAQSMTSMPQYQPNPLTLGSTYRPNVMSQTTTLSTAQLLAIQQRLHYQQQAVQQMLDQQAFNMPYYQFQGNMIINNANQISNQNINMFGEMPTTTPTATGFVNPMAAGMTTGMTIPAATGYTHTMAAGITSPAATGFVNPMSMQMDTIDPTVLQRENQESAGFQHGGNTS